MSGSAASPTGARCGQHPDVVAVALCARCGTYVCGACTEVVWEMAYCAPCAERHQQNTRPSPAVRLALAANLLGPFGALVVCYLNPVSRQIAVGVLLAWTFAAAVAGTVISTLKIRRHTELGDQGFAIVLRVLSALSLLGHLALGALMALNRHGR